jgi:iron complex outermembrane receptor protein
MGWTSISVADEESAESGIEEIVVTATRRETDIMDTPLAVSAATQAFLEKQGITNIKDLSYQMPSLSIQNTDTNAPIITLRGIRSTNVTEVGDPAVGIHVDGVYVPRPQGASALMFDLERAELMRGPQGTLFGRNSIVGTLNIVTAKPNFDGKSGSVTVNAGRFDERAVRAHFNLPVNEKLALRFAFMTEERDSYLNGFYDGSQPDWRYLPDGVRQQFQPVTDQSQLTTATDHQWYLGCQVWQEGCWFDPGWQIGLPQTKVKADSDSFYNNADNHAYRISALYQVSDNTDVTLQYEVYQDDGAGWQNQYSCEQMNRRTGKLQGDPAVYDANTCEDIMGTNDRYTVFVNTPGEIDMKIESIRAIFTHDFEHHSVVAKYGRQKLTQYSQFDIDGGANAGWDMTWVINDYVATSDVFDIELKNDSAKLAWVVGAFYMKEDNDMEAYFHATMNGDTIFRQPNREIESSAIFGQMTYAINEEFFLTLGARYSKDKKSDVGGKVYDCTVWNSCYPSTEVWGQRNIFPETLNALAPDFHIAGGQIAGINCEAQGGPYGGGPYLGATGCIVETAQNDVSETFSNTDWRIGLDWDISDNTFLYSYVASGFKSGSIADQYTRGDNTLHPEGAGSKVSTSYDEEEAVTFEVGYKARLLDNNLSLALNYYHTKYDGKQFTGNIPVDVIATTEFNRDTGLVEEVQQVVTIWGTQNFGDQMMQGIEFEFDWIPYEGGRLNGWVTLADTEIEDDYVTQWYYGMDAQFGRADYAQSIANVPENSVNLKGNEAPYSPDVAFTIRYEHAFNMGRFGTLTPSVSYHWQSEDYVSIWNADKHVNDAGGYGSGFSGNGDYVDLPGYFADDVNTFGDQRDSWHMTDVTVTYNPPGDQSWYVQAYGYNVTEEEIAWWRGVEAGNPRGAYSGPAQYGVRFNYSW